MTGIPRAAQIEVPLDNKDEETESEDGKPKKNKLKKDRME